MSPVFCLFVCFLLEASSDSEIWGSHTEENLLIIHKQGLWDVNTPGMYFVLNIHWKKKKSKIIIFQSSEYYKAQC